MSNGGGGEDRYLKEQFILSIVSSSYYSYSSLHYYCYYCNFILILKDMRERERGEERRGEGKIVVTNIIKCIWRCRVV